MNVASDKIKQIGIPRAISYYNNYPFYYGFFKSLGYEVVISDKTTTKLINEGSKYVVSDTCLPIKVYVCHVVNLLDKGCDTIFVPSLQSTAFKINNCSKIRGLPEIIRNVIDRDFKMIEPTLDKTENIGLNDFCTMIANDLEIFDENTIKSAMKTGFEMYNNFLEMTQSGVSYTEALKNALNGKIVKKTVDIVRPISVVVMAHGYNLFDEHISMNLIKKLEKMDVKVYTGLNVAKDDAVAAIKNIGEFQYWANELDLTGTAAHYLLNNKIDGIIALSAFGCGPDSLMFQEMEYHAKEKNVPIIHLTVDEHTGEAGFVTRLDAFVDMLIRKKRLNAVKKQKMGEKLLSSTNPNQFLALKKYGQKISEKSVTTSNVQM